MTKNKLIIACSWLIATILILLPFHAVFTTFLASHFHHFDLFRIWKELLIVPLGLGALIVFSDDQKTKRWLMESGLYILLSFYVGLFAIAGFVAVARHHVNANALIYGLMVDLRIPIFFAICLVISVHSSWLRRHWRRWLLISASLVIGFGLLQHFVLPANILTHIGYGPSTIPAYQTVDQKSQYVRVQSTLRGPNPLGAYLVIPITAFVLLVLNDKKRRWLWAGLLLAAVVVLFYSYSRSAWLGTALAVGLISWWQIKHRMAKRLLLLAAGLILIIGFLATLSLRHNSQFENTFFHTDQTSHSQDSSNQDRASALKHGLSDIIHEPWGSGPGTAGPASTRNNHPPRIAENYYLQLGQEVGIVGILLFVAINILVGVSLWQLHDELSQILLASLIGLSLVNMLSHAWADDTLGLLWWGLAGIALSSVILNKHKPNTNKPLIKQNSSHGKTKKAATA